MKLIGTVFLAFGLVFAGIGGWFFIDNAGLVASGSRAQGTVVSLDSRYDSDSGTTYRPIVEFTDASGTGHRFTGSVGSSPAAYSRGESVEVIYDPALPGQAIINSFTERLLFPLAFGGFGLLFAGIGGGILGYRWHRRRVIAQLRNSGLPINAEFLECYRDTSVKVNGRSPWRVVGQATHPATGVLTSFKSDAIWVDPSDQLKDKDLRVLVDPAKPKRYFVDLSEYVGEGDMG